MKESKAWSVSVKVSDVADVDRHFDLVADESTRAEIARLANLRSLPRLNATFDVAREGDGEDRGLHVIGRVSGLVGQTCVVTLEPIESEIDEAIDLIYSPSAAQEGKDVVVSPTQEPPEPLVGGAVDLGALVVEFLLLGIDPYPRKPGVEFATAHVGDPPDAKEHPFAALQALKKAGQD